jgi:uncharacterized protein (UPF0332 family)
MIGNDFIDFASKLAVSQPTTPAGCRSAVSRAYYGAFHMALEWLEESHFHKFGDNEHLQVQRHFQNCNVTEGIEIGTLLKNLHESRKDADYRLDKLQAETDANAKACVLRADAIRTRLQQASPSDPTGQAIVAGIEKFRQKLNIP